MVGVAVGCGSDAPATATPTTNPGVSVADTWTADPPGNGPSVAGEVEGRPYLFEGASTTVREPNLTVYDISEPTSPARVGGLDGPESARIGVISDLSLAGTVLYAVIGPGGLWVVDVSALAEPRQIAWMEIADGSGSSTPFNLPNGIAVRGDYAYIVGGRIDGSRFAVVDVSDLASPEFAGGLPPPHSGLTGRRVVVSGEYAYIAGRGLSAVSSSDQGTPSVVQGGREGLEIVDISDPRAPESLGVFFIDAPSAEMGLGASDVAVSDGYAYLATGELGFRVIDVSDPRSPREVGCLPTASTPDLLLIDDRAYVATFDEEKLAGDLLVVDVSNPTEPRLATSMSVQVGGNLAHWDGHIYANDNPRDRLVLVDGGGPGEMSGDCA